MPVTVEPPAGNGRAVGVVVGVSLLILMASGNPVLGLIFALFTALAWAVFHAPMRWTLLGLMSLAMFGDITPYDPRTNTIWLSVATPFQYFLLENLNKLTGIGALRMSGMEFALSVLLLLVGLRVLSQYQRDRRNRIPTPFILIAAFCVSFAAVLWLAVLGAARGGDMRQSFWQCRYLLFTPVLALLFSYALRGARDFKLIVAVVTLTSCAKIALAAYFVIGIALPMGYLPATATSHMDTVLFVVVLATWAAIAIDNPTGKNVLLSVSVWIWTVFGMVLNNRRTAIVSVGATMLLLFLTLSGRTKRRIVIAFAALQPLLLPYLLIGRSRTSGIFSPAAQFWSIFYQKDSSSITRDIENFNLIVTLKRHLLIGSGWGHEYVEQIKADDISMFFAQYRYIAHNSVLWLIGIGGLVGFTLLWLPIVVGTFLASLAAKRATTTGERVACYAANAVVISYLLQAWSDMGVVSWTTSSLLIVSLVTTGKLAVANSAWPDYRYLGLGAGIQRRVVDDATPQQAAE